MAIEPLFVSSIAALKSGLRLTGATQPDTSAIIDRIVQEVRVGFYDSLGALRISEILAMPVEENPTSASALTRLKAIGVEICWVKLRLLYELPVLFMDSSGQTAQVWNEEGLTRQGAGRDLEDLKEHLQEKVDNGLSELAGGDAPAGKVQAHLLGPETTPPRPRESVFGTTTLRGYC